MDLFNNGVKKFSENFEKKIFHENLSGFFFHYRFYIPNI